MQTSTSREPLASELESQRERSDQQNNNNVAMVRRASLKLEKRSHG